MAGGTLTLYNASLYNMVSGLIDLDTNSIKAALLTSAYTPSAEHSLWADVSANQASGTGYTAGGAALAAKSLTRSAAVTKFDSDDAVWDATGGSLSARYVVLYDDTATGKPLIGYALLDATPADLTATNASMTVGPSVADGWFQLTANA